MQHVCTELMLFVVVYKLEVAPELCSLLFTPHAKSWTFLKSFYKFLYKLLFMPYLQKVVMLLQPMLHCVISWQHPYFPELDLHSF